MKKHIISGLLLLATTIVMAQSSNCPKISKLIAEAAKKNLGNEATSEKFKTNDDFEASIASTKLDGATRCYVQDAHVSQMYVAEFGTSSASKEADPTLSKKTDMLIKTFKDCLGMEFVSREIKASENIFKGIQFDGRGANLNTKISILLIYNPGDKKQLLFVSMINDPD